jgi:glycine oxidase
MLAPHAEADGSGPFFSLLLHAGALYPAFVAALTEETGIDVGYRNDGALLIALSDGDEAELTRRLSWQLSAGLDVDRLTAAECLALEPTLSPNLRFALRFEGDHQVDNRLLHAATCEAASRAGAEFRFGDAVTDVSVWGNRLRLTLESGELVGAAKVVLAAGSWSGKIGGLPRALPVEPVHGQLISVDMAAPFIRHVIASPRGYIVPRAGMAIIGATAERIGFHAGVTLDGLRSLAEAAIDIVPSLGERPPVAHWSGFRPGTPDNLPILGPDPDLPTLLYATGHYRNGILLAPLTGDIIGDLALGRAIDIDLTPYRPDRFPA